MLTEPQIKFLKRYVISSGPKLDKALGELEVGARKAAAKKAKDKILDGVKARLDKVKDFAKLQPQDRLLNTGWMDRDAKAYDKMLSEIRVLLPTSDADECEKQIKALGDEAEKCRHRLSVDVKKDLDSKLDKTWPDLEAKARRAANSPKELLHNIEAIEAGMSEMRMALKIAGSKEEDVDFFSKRLDSLKQLYESKLPKSEIKPKDAGQDSQPEPKLIYSNAVCEKIYSLYGNNWFELKKAYNTPEFIKKVAEANDGKAPKDGKEAMWQLWAYRKETVDNLITKATKEFGVEGKGKGWVAVGSTNLESDYDLSVMMHGTKGKDFQVVDYFNKEFKAKYKTQPGIMFDTNLYATAPPEARMSDNPETPSEKAMAAMARSGQDVGALMKQRRFMSWDEYEDMMNAVLDEMESAKVAAEIVQATRTQFEEADNQYQLAQLRILEPGLAVLDGFIKQLSAEENKSTDPRRKARLKELLALQKTVKAKKTDATSASGSLGSKLILAAVSLLEGAEDVMLEVNNQIYAKAVEESRGVEKDALELAKEIEELEAEINGHPKTAQDPEETELKKLEAKLAQKKIDFEGKAARSKSLFTDSVFFANEAYHSDGPFKHVVQATQAVDSDVERDYKATENESVEVPWDNLDKTQKLKLIEAERKKRRDGLSLHECLQSFNEQLGDFIKDLHHHAEAKDEELPGTGFFRSSKYLDRLIDAVSLLDQKQAGGLKAEIPGNLASLKEYRSALSEGLLSMRKGKISIEAADIEGSGTDEEKAKKAHEQMEAFAIAEIKRLFDVTTLKALGQKFKTYGAKINAELRAQVALEMQALKDDAAFFATPQKRASVLK